jgi:UDP-glucose 4-epimerase
MDSRRILVTGVSTYWGGRLAQALEAFPEVEAVIAVDNEEPQVELERTEYVKVGAQHALLRRVVEAAEIDTVVDTRLVVDSKTTTSAKAHENNVIGTMNILAACSGPQSPVRKVIFKSSTHYYGAEQDDPAFFDETMRRPHAPRTGIERDVVEAEASVNEFAERNPNTAVTVLRFANVLGPSVRSSHIDLFSLPAVPMVLGFDPRYQFVHEDDVVHALEHAVKVRAPGVFNVAADGVLALSEVAGLLGKPYAPILPPWGTGMAAAALRRVGLRIPPEAMNQLRFGRGVDNRRYKAAGFRYQYTSRETVVALGEHLRLHPLLRGAQEPYRYEREVEEFLRWSPHVKNARDKRASAFSNEQLHEMERLLTSFTETAGLAGEEAEAERGEAERLAAERAGHAEQRLSAAEQRAMAAEAAAERATERAKRAERRAAEAALKATERAKKAERRARAAASEAVERVERSHAEAGTAEPGARAEPATRGEPAAPAGQAGAAPAGAAAEQGAAAPAAAEQAVAPAAGAAAAPPSPHPVEHYDDLAAEEVIALLASLERDDLGTLRDYERRHANRARVLAAIDSVLARAPSRA